MSDTDTFDPDSAPNGLCDECDAPIADAEPGEPRRCSVNDEHDPYSDGFQNGGDPLFPPGAFGEDRQYVVVVTIPDEGTDITDDIDAVCRAMNEHLARTDFSVRPLSEVIAS